MARPSTGRTASAVRGPWARKGRRPHSPPWTRTSNPTPTPKLTPTLSPTRIPTPTPSPSQAALAAFVSDGLRSFEGREKHRADEQNTAAISPYLRFGELSARDVRAAVREALGEARAPSFERKLAWRDLSAWSLWRFPDLSDEPFRKHYGAQQWETNPQMLASWQAGRTGY